ncbi:hypothetical protein JNUCC42_22730 [Brevibacterium sp. JNUCC-42]|nr:hypothetical protein JNUCC42_22730 [Brevibacterium sp. JNUCC-42]
MNVAMLTLWGIWDKIYHCCSRLNYIQKEQNIFRYAIRTYRGETLQTDNGIVIQKGDVVIRLHIHNYLLAKRSMGIHSDVQIGLTLVREVRKSLPQLAKMLISHPKEREIKGIVGTTMLFKVSGQLGFSMSPVPDVWYFKFKRWYLTLLKIVMHPKGRKAPTSIDPLTRVFMSKEELLKRFYS